MIPEEHTRGRSALLNKFLMTSFWEALPLAVKNPPLLLFVIKCIFRQKRAMRLRAAHEARSLHVPPYIIISVTRQCNLACAGCYDLAKRHAGSAELSGIQLRELISQAGELGVSFIILAGGEPFMRPELLRITRSFPHILFPVFSNGLLLDDDIIEELRRQKQVIPIFSLEGDKNETDLRRGEGVYGRVMASVENVQRAGIFWGISITVTSRNFAAVTAEGFIRQLAGSGCKLFVFIEFTPPQEEVNGLAISAGQKQELIRLMGEFTSKFPAIFTAFPGDEERYGGCVAAGRGFVHISSEGWLEPCPFSPLTDVNVTEIPLREALRSPLLKALRDQKELLGESSGGCALWKNRERIASLFPESRPPQHSDNRL